jgi:hypothetical protein
MATETQIEITTNDSTNELTVNKKPVIDAQDLIQAVGSADDYNSIKYAKNDHGEQAVREGFDHTVTNIITGVLLQAALGKAELQDGDISVELLAHGEDLNTKTDLIKFNVTVDGNTESLVTRASMLDQNLVDKLSFDQVGSAQEYLNSEARLDNNKYDGLTTEELKAKQSELRNDLLYNDILHTEVGTKAIDYINPIVLFDEQQPRDIKYLPEAIVEKAQPKINYLQAEVIDKPIDQIALEQVAEARERPEPPILKAKPEVEERERPEPPILKAKPEVEERERPEPPILKAKPEVEERERPEPPILKAKPILPTTNIAPAGAQLDANPLIVGETEKTLPELKRPVGRPIPKATEESATEAKTNKSEVEKPILKKPKEQEETAAEVDPRLADLGEKIKGKIELAPDTEEKTTPRPIKRDETPAFNSSREPIALKRKEPETGATYQTGYVRDNNNSRDLDKLINSTIDKAMPHRGEGLEEIRQTGGSSKDLNEIIREEQRQFQQARDKGTFVVDNYNFPKDSDEALGLKSAIEEGMHIQRPNIEQLNADKSKIVSISKGEKTLEQAESQQL